MTFLAGLHGSVAILLICVFLFVDEAGVPLPVAPSEGMLLLTGVLIASDAFPAWLIVPLCAVAMTAGMLTGYSWARTAGQATLRRVAQRVGAITAYDQAQTRLRSAGPLQIGVARLLPGLRPYATLVSGAAEIDVRTFLLGALPALLIWEVGWILLGMLVGLPAAHFLGRFEKLALRGGILILLGVAVWFLFRRIPAGEHGGLVKVAPPLRKLLAFAVDGGITASVVTGLFAIGRRAVHISADGWIELIAIGLMLVLVVIVQPTRATTPGEALFNAS